MPGVGGGEREGERGRGKEGGGEATRLRHVTRGCTVNTKEKKRLRGG